MERTEIVANSQMFMLNVYCMLYHAVSPLIPCVGLLQDAYGVWEEVAVHRRCASRLRYKFECLGGCGNERAIEKLLVCGTVGRSYGWVGECRRWYVYECR